ncbi:MAG: putative bifunctional diguanylate cyclase/phosphodiesterase [Mycobacteriales bacterium]
MADPRPASIQFPSAQRWALAGLLAMVIGLGVVAIDATGDVSRQARQATLSTQIDDSFQNARVQALQAVSAFDEYRLHHTPAAAKAARTQVASFQQTLARLSGFPGQRAAVVRLQVTTAQLVASANRANRLYRHGHVDAAARLDNSTDKLADVGLLQLSDLQGQAQSRSEGQLDRIRHGASQLGYATPIVLIGVILLALLSAAVIRRDRRRMATLAATDGLTDLPNRLALAHVVTSGLRAERAKRGADAGCTLLLLDLDRFKEVNDGLGHQYGDELLRTVANRIRGTVSKSDTVARIGGDEFVVFLRGGGTMAGEAAARRIRDVLRTPFSVDGVEVDLDASIGVVAADGDALTDHASLLRAADLAMYAAKANGGGHAIYTPALGASVEAKVVVVGQVRHAIEADEFVLHYQPQISLDDQRLVGVEALLRWDHPERGLIPPGEFLPAIEDHQIIDQVTAVVLRKALRQSRMWQSQGLRIPISVNVATRALLNVSFPKEVASLLNEYGVDPELLCLELTETSVMGDSDRCARTLWALHELGVRLSVDDYGTGYASMFYLKSLPLDELKIDRSFVMRMMDDAQHRVLTQSVIELGHNLGLSVVAEGVEHSDVRQALHESGCDIAQGYLYSRPVPPEAILDWHGTAAGPAGPAIPGQRADSDAGARPLT